MSSDHLDISRRGYAANNETGEVAYTDEAVQISDGTVTRHIADPFGFVPTEPHATTSQDVTKWELRAHVERENIIAQYRRMPEARRRRDDRETERKRRRAGQATGPCADCGGSGWINDDSEGKGYNCPACRGR